MYLNTNVQCISILIFLPRDAMPCDSGFLTPKTGENLNAVTLNGGAKYRCARLKSSTESRGE